MKGAGARVVAVTIGRHSLAFYSFIHSFRLFLLSLFKFTTTQRLPTTADTVSDFHTKVPQATVSEGLSQGPYVADVGFEPATIRTIHPQRPTNAVHRGVSH